MPELQELSLPVIGGYAPNVPAIGCPQMYQNTFRAGLNCWPRAGGRVEVANGAAQTSATNVGARLFQYGTQRASIEGALVSGRIPYAGLLRYQNAAMIYLSELTSKQVYLDETAASGVTTSATAGMLRVAINTGSWSVYDAGFDRPTLSAGSVTTSTTGVNSMNGSTGVTLAAWRTKTNAISAPATIVYSSMNSSTANIMLVALPSAVSGQDGWVMGGTNWGDASGNARVVRYIRIAPRGTFTATNGSANITAGSGTFFTQDLRPYDVITIDAASYTVLSVTSDAALTLTANFGGSTGSGKTATITTAAGDWRNGSLGELLNQDVAKPVKAAGVFSYAQRVFLWGCYGQDSSAVTGPAIVPLWDSNPEHISIAPNAVILTANGDDIMNVLPGETRLYVMTPNTLESVTFTGSEDAPYKVRVLYQPGFAAAMNGIVFKDRFYGYSERPLRTTVDDNIDVEFGVGVISDMRSWTSSRVVLAADPRNEAVLYCHYDGSSTTTVIPYLVNLGIWGVPHQVTGQVVDSTIVNGLAYLVVIVSSNYRVYGWEQGTAGSASTPYVATQFLDAGSVLSRKAVKSIGVSGKVSYVRAYRIAPGGTYPDLTSTGAATASFTMSSSEKTEKEIRTHIPDCRAVAVRVDFPTSGSLDALSLRGYAKDGVI